MWNVVKVVRLSPGASAGRTRWRVAGHRSLVQRVISSPTLITKARSTTGMSIQVPGSSRG